MPAHGADDDRRDFFISHASADEGWAEWIAAQLQDAGFSIELDVWEWTPGEDFIAAMETGLKRADRVIAIYSRSYFTRPYAQVEHRAAFATASSSGLPRVIPVQVEPCVIPELYGNLIRIDIVDVDEAVATRRLLDGVSAPIGRRHAPSFPGTSGSARLASGHAIGYPGKLPEIWKVPSRNAFFVGRDQLIERLHRNFQQPSKRVGRSIAVISLQGISGIGKTQLAVEYAHRYSLEYAIVWWVDADTVSLIENGLMDLARSMSLPIESPTRTIDRLWTVLSRRSDWLLIYDNVDAPATIAGLRPPLNGHWLITSRNPRTSRLGDPVEIAEFERSESMDLLRLRAPWLSSGQADVIADALGDLPLAIEQAGYFLADTGLGIEDYLQWLTDRPFEAGFEDSTIDRHPGLVAVVGASIEQLEKVSPAAANVLNVISFLAPEPLPVAPAPGSKNDGTPFGVCFGSVALTAEIIRELTGCGLVRRVGSSLQIHRLTQLLLRARFSGDSRTRLARAAVSLLAKAEPGDALDTRNWFKYAMILPHAQALLSSDVELVSTEEPEPFFELVRGMTHYLYRAGQYQTGVELSILSQEKLALALGRTHLYVLRMTSNLGMCLTGLGQFGAASDIFRRLRDEYSSTLGPTSLRALHAGNNLGVALIGLKEYESAVGILSEALDGMLSTAGPRDVETLRTADNLGEALTGLEDYQAASELLSDTLRKKRQILSDDHPDTLESAFNLSMAMAAIDPVEAAKLLHDTFERQRRVLGKDHPNTIRTGSALQQLS
jgi:tetratricopeptide (TPR) repeat protein